MSKKYKILVLSDSAHGMTGFGQQTRGVMNYLHSTGKFEVVHIAWNYSQQPFKKIVFDDDEEINFKTIPGGRDNYARDILQDTIRNEQPDIVWVLLDTFMLYPWVLNIDFTPAKTVFYYPSDGGYFPLNCEQVLRKFDYPVAMARFGQKQVKKLHNIDAHHIPHGVKTDLFKPFSEEEKKKWRKHWKVDGKFIVGVVARNQPRKNNQALLRSFAKFAEGKDDVLLCLHMDMFDPVANTNLWELVKRYKLENKVQATGIKWFSGFTNDEMAALYNVFDIFLLTTTGEGFGVPLIEALSCGIPIVATDYTTTPEIVLENNAGLGCKVAAEVTGNWNVDRGFVDCDDVAEKLERLYEDAKMRKKMGENGRKAAVEEYEWAVQHKRWEEFLLNTVLEERK